MKFLFMQFCLHSCHFHSYTHKPPSTPFLNTITSHCIKISKDRHESRKCHSINDTEEAPFQHLSVRYYGNRGTSLLKHPSLMRHCTSNSPANAFHSKETIKKQHIIKPQTRRVSAMDRDHVGQLRILAASASGNQPRYQMDTRLQDQARHEPRMSQLHISITHYSQATL